MNKVLVVIDAQEDFTRGALRNEHAIKALPTIKDAVWFAEMNHMPVIYTADSHTNKYLETQEGKNLPIPHCIYGEPGWEICDEVKCRSSYFTLCKETFGSIAWNGWQASERITPAEEIWLCGFCTNICVSANFQILKAMYPEKPIVVIEDACAGVTPELHDAALKVMKSCQARIVKWADLKKENEQ